MSFNWTTHFRAGSYYEFRNFALNQRKNIEDRVRSISIELNKIGYIRVVYARNQTNKKMTERRIGLEIMKGSSLYKLLVAYVVRGGNPFDISMFLKPDSYTWIDDAVYETQPYTGVLYPQSENNPVSTGNQSIGGWLPLWKFPARKMGKNINIYDFGQDVSNAIITAKSWIPQEIKELRNDLEMRIIKLCDLREQLLKERDEVLKTLVGGITASFQIDSDSYSESHHLSFIINVLDDVIYPNINAQGERDFTNPRVSTDNSQYKTIVDNAPNNEEKWTAL